MICTFPLTLHNTQLLAIITLKKTILQQWTNMLMFFSLTGFQTLLTGASGGVLRSTEISLRRKSQSSLYLPLTNHSSVMSPSQGGIWAVILLSGVFIWESQQRATWSSHKQARFPSAPKSHFTGEYYTYLLRFMCKATEEIFPNHTKPRQPPLTLSKTTLHLKSPNTNLIG